MTQGSNPQHAAPSADSVEKTQAPPPDTVNLTINGRAVTARKGTLLVEAAKQVGIDIPIFCYHPKLKSVGACRMCLVQLEKLPRLQTACTTPVAADMVVHTDTPEVIAAQNGVLELLLANHPLDCPICDKGGECPLQDNTFRYGPGASCSTASGASCATAASASTRRSRATRRWPPSSAGPTARSAPCRAKPTTRSF